MMELKIITVFQQTNRFFKKISHSDHISAWKPRGLSDESIKHPTLSNNSLAPSLNHTNTNMRVTFDGSCLKQ